MTLALIGCLILIGIIFWVWFCIWIEDWIDRL